MDITPETHVKMSTAKFLSIIGGIIVLVAAAVGVYTSLVTKVNLHVADTDVHLDKEYMKDHGRPVGKWDLDVVRGETNRRLDEQSNELKEIHVLILNQASTRKR